MLVLSRRQGETLVINGDIVIKVIEMRGGAVRLGIEAPREVSVARSEILSRTPIKPSIEAGCLASRDRSAGGARVGRRNRLVGSIR